MRDALTGKVNLHGRPGTFRAHITQHKASRSPPAVLRCRQHMRAMPGAAASSSGSAFAKGDPVWYRHRSGTHMPAKVTYVDLSLQPPAYQVETEDDGVIRDTEGPRLLARQPGAPPPPPGAPPAAANTPAPSQTANTATASPPPVPHAAPAQAQATHAQAPPQGDAYPPAWQQRSMPAVAQPVQAAGAHPTADMPAHSYTPQAAGGPGNPAQWQVGAQAAPHARDQSVLGMHSAADMFAGMRLADAHHGRHTPHAHAHHPQTQYPPAGYASHSYGAAPQLHTPHAAHYPPVPAYGIAQPHVAANHTPAWWHSAQHAPVHGSSQQYPALAPQQGVHHQHWHSQHAPAGAAAQHNAPAQHSAHYHGQSSQPAAAATGWPAAPAHPQFRHWSDAHDVTASTQPHQQPGGPARAGHARSAADMFAGMRVSGGEQR